jgi:hypothetical protein
MEIRLRPVSWIVACSPLIAQYTGALADVPIASERRSFQSASSMPWSRTKSATGASMFSSQVGVRSFITTTEPAASFKVTSTMRTMITRRSDE